MDKKKFTLINRVVSAVILVFSAIVYLMTIEPTASFWDCGEFIASSYKLEVGHPPGNPVFQLFARFFCIFTDASHAAIAVNCCSAICSAFTIFFLYLTLVHFGRSLLEKDGKELTLANVISVLGAGVVGSVAYTFTDTFWFSAVEGEVYAMSSLFTAAVFWAMLKWEEEADEPYANRWIVLICLLMGLSVGVHLLNLLSIPPMVFIYYYRKHGEKKISFWKSCIVFFVSCIILMVILFGIIPYTPKIAAFVDRIFVNGLGTGFNVGTTVFMVLLFAACFGGMYLFRKKGKALAHTITLCFTTILIGYSVFAIIIIRSSAQTPTNEYQPDNAYTLVRYLSREQYGKSPLVLGGAYTSVYDVKRGTYYTPLNGKYFETDSPLEAVYPSGTQMFFPRMWSSSSSSHTSFYDSYTQGRFKTNIVKIDGNSYKNRTPYFKDNLRFFFDYQLNYMYFRYFFWNFVGRQNDFHGQIPGDVVRGNWESGICFIDRARLGDQSEAPDYLKNNKGKNHYYFLPLILGLIGLFYQLGKDKRNSWVTILFFFMTGIAIILYLNQTPYQVRERDYSYAGSFYVFALWMGLAVMWLKELFDKLLKKEGVANAGVATVLCLSVSILMGCENWDDHDRSGRTTARDIAYNYLSSCDKDAILITHGDNDTFPLWYAQEVESIRTDIRIMNTSLLGMDWYIDQMKNQVYDSKPLQISLPRADYLYGTNDWVEVVDAVNRPILASEAMDIFKNPKYRRGRTGMIASKHIRVPVNKENAVKYGIVKEKDADRMVDYLDINLKVDRLQKFDLIILDILSNYQWDRPIYFVSQYADGDLGLGKYLQCEGFAYKVTPILANTEEGELPIDSEKVYDLLMTKLDFDGNADTTVLVDYQNLYTFVAVNPLRSLFVEEALKLKDEGKADKAEKILDRCYEVTPKANYPYCISLLSSANEYSIVQSIDLYLDFGKMEKAKALAEGFLEDAIPSALYFGQIVGGEMLNKDVVTRDMQCVYMISQLFEEKNEKEYAESIINRLQSALTN